MSVYEPSPIKRRRRSRAELRELDSSLARIVAEIEPATVRQVFYQAVVRALVPKDEARGYKLVQRRLLKLRESGEVPYGWITDNVRIVRGHNRYEGLSREAFEAAFRLLSDPTITDAAGDEVEKLLALACRSREE
jgi:hypothetical protein